MLHPPYILRQSFVNRRILHCGNSLTMRQDMEGLKKGRSDMGIDLVAEAESLSVVGPSCPLEVHLCKDRSWCSKPPEQRSVAFHLEAPWFRQALERLLWSYTFGDWSVFRLSNPKMAQPVYVLTAFVAGAYGFRHVEPLDIFIDAPKRHCAACSNAVAVLVANENTTDCRKGQVQQSFWNSLTAQSKIIRLWKVYW